MSSGPRIATQPHSLIVSETQTAVYEYSRYLKLGTSAARFKGEGHQAVVKTGLSPPSGLGQQSEA